MNRSQLIQGFIFLFLVGGSIGAFGQSERPRQTSTPVASQKWERIYSGDDGARFKSVYSTLFSGGKSAPSRWLWIGDDKGFVRLSVLDPDSSAWLEPRKNAPGFFALSKLEVGASGGKDTDSSSPVNSIWFFDQKTGYLLKGNKLYSTDNGGFRWTLIFNTPNLPDKSVATLQSIAITPSKHACMVGMYSLGNLVTNSLVLCTEKTLGADGAQWMPIKVPTESQLWHVSFLDDKHGWIVGAAGTILKTDDGGKSWLVVPIEAESLLHSCFLDDRNGWIVGRFGTILRTTDRGEHWQPVTLDFASEISEIHLRNMKFAPNNVNGWIVGDQGTILSTDDGGETWELQQPPLPKEGNLDPNALTALFVDDEFCWAVGGTGLSPKSGSAAAKSAVWRYRWK